MLLFRDMSAYRMPWTTSCKVRLLGRGLVKGQERQVARIMAKKLQVTRITQQQTEHYERPWRPWMP
jgi:hypothetical protein